MTPLLEDLQRFLDQAPTAYHAVQEVGDRLALRDFTPLKEEDLWSMNAGGRYFVVRGGALCAFILPTQSPKRALILGAHTDSPGLKLKPLADYCQGNYWLLGTEIYGAPLLSSWLNRDLGIAGRVFITDSEGASHVKLVWIDDAPGVIAQLALHLNHNVNSEGLVVDKQNHLTCFGGLCAENSATKGFLESLLRRHISFNSLLGFDLFLVPLEAARFGGYHGEFLSSYRLDNLAGCHACLTALGLLEKPSEEMLQMIIFWNHEEIGSRTREGADSPFLADILTRIRLNVEIDEESWLRMKCCSQLVSVDAAHALHPGYEDKFDPRHLPLMGKGIVLKYHAGHRYTTDGATGSAMLSSLSRLGVPHQPYVTRNNLNSGSTIGPIVETQLGIPSVDLGIPLLSMHSIREVMASKDYLDLCALLHDLFLHFASDQEGAMYQEII
jgi:aspartyl aminopeptidase